MVLHLGKAFGIFILASTFTTLTLLWLLTVVLKIPAIMPESEPQPALQPQAAARIVPVTVANLH
jgi:hypothetical protein